MIPNFSNYDYFSNNRRSTYKRSWGNTFVCRLLHGIWLHTHRKDQAKTSRINYKNAQQKHEMFLSPDDDVVTGALRGDTLPLFLFINQPKLYATNVNKSNKRKWFHSKKKTGGEGK